MKIGLIDVDGRVLKGKHNNGMRYPNIALMKLSAWHKLQGDLVEWCIPLERYDRVYMSKVFTFSPDFTSALLCDDVRRGGTGYGLDNKLPDEVEHMMPDYSLYGVEDTAYGFMSRGCPRGCPFCIVAAKEGRASRKVADLREFWNGQKFIKLMDPNSIACPDWADILGQLEESHAWIDFSQGVDIRLMDDRKCDAILRLKMKMIHFAWDRHEDDLEPVFARFAPRFRKLSAAHRLRVYVLVNFGSTMENNLHRIYILRGLGYDPFVMIYDKDNADEETKRLARWVNHKGVFWTCPKFEDYKRK